MKATITFQLPEEREEHELALKGASLRAALDDFRAWLFWEIDESERPEAEIKILEEVQRNLLEKLND